MTKVRMMLWVLAVLLLVGFVAAGCGSASDQTKHQAKKKVEAKGHQAKQEAKNKLKSKGQQATQKAKQKRDSRQGGSKKSKGY
jgi:Flp pilus assembly protein TadB